MPNFPVDPARPVDVLHDGQWFAGFLYWWRRDGDSWRSVGVRVHDVFAG